jgi:hypothetical protein
VRLRAQSGADIPARVRGTESVAVRAVHDGDAPHDLGVARRRRVRGLVRRREPRVRPVLPLRATDPAGLIGPTQPPYVNCQGLIEYTGDGGRTWSSRLFPRIFAINGLTAVSADHVYVRGFTSTESTDQGRTLDDRRGTVVAGSVQAARDRTPNGVKVMCTRPSAESCQQYAVQAPASTGPSGPPRQLSPSLVGSVYLVANIGGREWLVTAEVSAIHSAYSTDAGRHWTPAEVPVTRSSPAPGSFPAVPRGLVLLADPDGRGRVVGSLAGLGAAASGAVAVRQRQLVGGRHTRPCRRTAHLCRAR